jgi:hypothetical protein
VTHFPRTERHPFFITLDSCRTGSARVSLVAHCDVSSSISHARPQAPQTKSKGKQESRKQGVITTFDRKGIHNTLQRAITAAQASYLFTTRLQLNKRQQRHTQQLYFASVRHCIADDNITDQYTQSLAKNGGTGGGPLTIAGACASLGYAPDAHTTQSPKTKRQTKRTQRKEITSKHLCSAPHSIQGRYRAINTKSIKQTGTSNCHALAKRRQQHVLLG